MRIVSAGAVGGGIERGAAGGRASISTVRPVGSTRSRCGVCPMPSMVPLRAGGAGAAAGARAGGDGGAAGWRAGGRADLGRAAAKNVASSAMSPRRFCPSPAREMRSSAETSPAVMSRCSSLSDAICCVLPSASSSVQLRCSGGAAAGSLPGRNTLKRCPQLVHLTVVPRSETSVSSNSYSVPQRSQVTSMAGSEGAEPSRMRRNLPRLRYGDRGRRAAGTGGHGDRRDRAALHPGVRERTWSSAA